MFIECELLWVFALYVRRMVNIVIVSICGPTLEYHISNALHYETMCVFDVPNYLPPDLLSAIAQVFVLAFFTATFRAPVGIPRMSLGHLSDASTSCTHIQTHRGVIGHARLQKCLQTQAFRQPLLC